LRARVPADRLLVAWGGTAERRRVTGEIVAFQMRIAALPPMQQARRKGEEINA
jgi:hypothetical protein